MTLNRSQPPPVGGSHLNFPFPDHLPADRPIAIGPVAQFPELTR